jgi:hypothetical protein
MRTTGGVAEPVELTPIEQREIDGDPRRERPIRAQVGLGIEDHDDGRAVIEMGVEVPPLVAALFRVDTLGILEFNQIGAIANQSQQQQYSGRVEPIHVRRTPGVWKNAQTCNCSGYSRRARHRGDGQRHNRVHWRSYRGRDRDKDDAGQLGKPAANTCAGVRL